MTVSFGSGALLATIAPGEAAVSERLGFYLLKGVNKAIRDYQMIADGDRIAVAVSGGKDSLTLLRVLQARQRTAQERYDLVAVHVVAEEAACGGGADRDLLEAYLAGQGVELVMVPLPIPSGQPKRVNQSPCFHCAWRRRKAIFQAAERLGCQKVAFGHHADDLAETALLNLFFHGKVETMAPRLSFFDGKLIVIRPLAYIQEKEIIRFARTADFPPPPPTCAGADRSQRALMRQIIRQVEAVNPKVRIHLFRAAVGVRAKKGESKGALREAC